MLSATVLRRLAVIPRRRPAKSKRDPVGQWQPHPWPVVTQAWSYLVTVGKSKQHMHDCETAQCIARRRSCLHKVSKDSAKKEGFAATCSNLDAQCRGLGSVRGRLDRFEDSEAAVRSAPTTCHPVEKS